MCKLPNSIARRSLQAMLGLLLLVCAGLPGNASASLVDCDSQLRVRGPGFETLDCFRAYVTETQDRASAVQRLQALRSLHPEDPWITYTLGLILRAEFEEIEALFLHAIEGFQRRGEPDAAALAAAELVDEASHQSQHDAGERHLAAAYSAAERDGARRVSVLRLMAREAKLAQSRMQWDRSWSVGWGTIRDPAFDELHVEHRLSVYYAVASGAHFLGHLEQSVEYAERAVELAEREGDKKHKADAALNLAWVAASAVDWELFTREEALEITRSAWTRVEESGNKILRAIYLRELTRVADGAGRMESLDELERIGLRTGHAHLLSSVYANRAVAILDDDSSRAQEAIEWMRKAASFPELWRATANLTSYFTNLTRIAIELDDRELALDSGARAMDYIERVRESIRIPEIRARVVAGHSQIYYLMADYLLSPETALAGDEAAALAAMERLRGRVLVDARERQGETEIDSETDSEWGDVRKEVSQLQLKLMAETDLQHRRPLLHRLELLESREDDLRRQLLALADRPLPQPLAELAQVQSALADDEVMLYFISAPRVSSYLLAIDRTAARVFPLPEADQIFPAIRLWTGLLNRQDEIESQAANRVGGMLGGSIRPAIAGKRKITIVADGPYHRLPFPALYVEGERLGARYELQSFPSATYFVAVRGEEVGSRANRALVLADPRFDPSLGRDRSDGGGEEPVVRGGSLRLRDAGFADLTLEALPFARGEARTVLLSTGNAGLARFGAEASEAFLKAEDLKNYSVIHFAAHALLNERLPHRSAVVLAPGEGEDGLLQARDIERLGLQQPLVVLAACQSAAGDYVRGEGVFSLARSFLEAGAGAVVASRWPIRDDEASKFFSSFYRGIGGGHTVAESLRLAREDAIARGLAPSSWAGFVVIGNGDQVVGSTQAWGGAVRWVIPVAAVGILVAICAAWLRRRRFA